MVGKEESRCVMYTYDQRLERVLNRRNPWPKIAAGRASFANERAFDSAEMSSSVERMVYLAMQPVDDECVKKSMEAGERVKERLRARFFALSKPVPTFKYQGSVVANTQIKGASDIDLLVINEQSFFWDSIEITSEWKSAQIHAPIPAEAYKLKRLIDLPIYSGNVVDDISNQRKVCEDCLSAVYADCDIRKGKSIRIVNQSLDQKVDIVNCLWFDNAESIKHDGNYPYRGVRIFDKSKTSWMPEDFPFIKMSLMDSRNTLTNGHFKEMIRLVKTLKVDVGGCDEFSSFDIYSVLYSMPQAAYATRSGNELVFALETFLREFAINRTLADRLKQLGGNDSIFKGDDLKFRAFRQVYDDVRMLCEALRNVRRRRVAIFG